MKGVLKHDVEWFLFDLTENKVTMHKNNNSRNLPLFIQWILNRNACLISIRQKRLRNIGLFPQNSSNWYVTQSRNVILSSIHTTFWLFKRLRRCINLTVDQIWLLVNFVTCNSKKLFWKILHPRITSHGSLKEGFRWALVNDRKYN